MNSINSSINTKDQFIKYPHYPNSLTTVVGINCKDGIVLCADSQETYFNEEGQPMYKRLIQQKLADIGTHGHYIIGCSGMSADLELLVEYLNRNEKLSNQTVYDEKCFYNNLEVIMEDFLAKYNIIQPTKTHSRYDPKYFIKVDALLVARISSAQDDRNYALYKIQTGPPLRIRSVPIHASIGSGSTSVKLMLDQISKKLDEMGYNWQSVSTKLAARIAYMILEVVMQSDFGTGGTTKYRILYGETGLEQSKRINIWDDVNKSHLIQTLQLVCEELPKIRDRIKDIATSLNLY